MEQALKQRDPMLMASALYEKLEEVYENLEIGDIVLVNRKFGIYQQILKKVTGRSHWNHMAMVFDIVKTDDDHHDVIVIEALEQGIEVHRLQKYIRRPDGFDLGFKRLPGLKKSEKERIRGFFLDAVDTPYDYSSAITYLFKKPLMHILGTEVTDFIARKVIKPSYFVCTSFAQRAFYMALPPNERDRSLFIPDDDNSKDLNFLYQLIEITPTDVARSKNTQWLYNVRY